MKLGRSVRAISGGPTSVYHFSQQCQPFECRNLVLQGSKGRSTAATAYPVSSSFRWWDCSQKPNPLHANRIGASFHVRMRMRALAHE